MKPATERPEAPQEDPTWTPWNVGLCVAPGLLRFASARLGERAWSRAVAPASAMRPSLLALTGTAIFFMMAPWRPTGAAFFRLPLADAAEAVVVAAIFAIPAASILQRLIRTGVFEFLGRAQLVGPASASGRKAGASKLGTDGIHGGVRHPVYTWILAIFLLGPTLSLARLTLFLAATASLSVGSPVEERTLIRSFGDSCVEYRRRVSPLPPTSPPGVGWAGSAERPALVRADGCL